MTTDLEGKKTRKAAKKANAVEREVVVPKEVIKPGAIVIGTITGQRMRIENVKRYDVAVTDGVPLCVIQSFDGRVRTLVLERGWIVEFQPGA